MYWTNNRHSAATTLLCYFARSRIPDLQNLLYTECYEQYCLYSRNSKTQNWTPLEPDDYLEIPRQPSPQLIIRKLSRGQVVVRIRTVPPRTGELFYLRVLLLHKPAFCFEHPCLVGDTIHRIFYEAAAALCLFQNANEAHHALTEATNTFVSP